MRRFAIPGLFVGDITPGTPVSGTILGVDGEQADGSFHITLDSVAGMTTNDMFCPAREATITYHEDVPAAFAAASADDSLLIGFSDANGNKTHMGSINNGAVVNDGVNAFGMLPGINFQANDNKTGYHIGDISNDVEIYNLGFHVEVYGVYTTGSGGNTVTVARCRLIGGQTNVFNNGSDALIIINNWLQNALSQGYNSTTNPTVLIAGNTVTGAFAHGIDLDHRTGITCINNLCFNNSADFRNATASTFSNNASRDSTAPGAGSIPNISAAAMKLFEYDYGRNGFSPRIGSNLENAGIANAALTEDLCGNLRSVITPTIGANEAGCQPVKFPDTADVLSTTYVDFAVGTWVKAQKTLYKLGEFFGINGTSEEGELPGGTPPTTALLDMADNLDGTSAKATITDSQAGVTNNIYTALRGVSSWTLQGSIVGNGELDIDLAAQEYIGQTVPIDGGIPGLPGGPKPFRVTTSRRRVEYWRDRTALVLLRIAERDKGVPAKYFETPAADAVDIVAILGVVNMVTSSISASETDVRSLVLTIPRQTGFPPARFKTGHLIELKGVKYSIDDVSFLFEDEEMTPGVVFECSRYDLLTVEIDG
jgi:hypothetical protein